MANNIMDTPVSVIFQNIFTPWKIHGYSTNDELVCLADTEKNSGYGTKHTFIRCGNLDKYIKRFVLPRHKHYFAISASLRSKFIPMVDADSEDNMVRATLWLDENNIKYAVMSSSPGHYWIFLDKPFKKAKKAGTLSSYVPGNDQDFVGMIEKNNHIYIRGRTKGYKPKLENCNTDSDLIKTFVTKLEAHYRDPRLDWVDRYYAAHDKGIDISDPKSGDPIPVTINQFI